MWDALLACLSSSRRPCRRMVVVGHSFSYFAWDVGVRGLWPRPGPKPRRKPAGGPARSASRRLLLSAPRPDGPHRAARAASVPQAAASCGLSESPSWLAVVRVVAVPAPARPPPRGRGIQGRLQRPRHLLSLSAAAASPPRSRRGSFSLRAPDGSMPPRGGPRGAIIVFRFAALRVLRPARSASGRLFSSAPRSSDARTAAPTHRSVAPAVQLGRRAPKKESNSINKPQQEGNRPQQGPPWPRTNAAIRGGDSSDGTFLRSTRRQPGGDAAVPAPPPPRRGPAHTTPRAPLLLPRSAKARTEEGATKDQRGHERQDAAQHAAGPRCGR